MSSFLTFVRAAIMLVCLVAIPVLALTQGTTLVRVKEAAARAVGRLSANREPSLEERQPRGAANPSTHEGYVQDQMASGGGAEEAVWPSSLPEPVEEENSAVTHEIMSTSTSSGSRRGLRSTPGPIADPAASSTVSSSTAAAWQQRAAILQQLGAEEYSLERWGRSGELYRFQCLVSVEGAASCRKHFEAVDADGGRAVERVLERVRAWRGMPTEP